PTATLSTCPSSSKSSTEPALSSTPHNPTDLKARSSRGSGRWSRFAGFMVLSSGFLLSALQRFRFPVGALESSIDGASACRHSTAVPVISEPAARAESVGEQPPPGEAEQSAQRELEPYGRAASATLAESLLGWRMA